MRADIFLVERGYAKSRSEAQAAIKAGVILSLTGPAASLGIPEKNTINVLPKYVPSTTLTDPTWQNTHVLTGDVEAAVRELKATPGRDLLLQGSGAGNGATGQ